MALRIGSGKVMQHTPMVPQDEQLNLHAADEGDAAAQEMAEPQAEEQGETPEQEASEGSQGQGGALDPTVAGYKTPDEGPFKCANCIHYGVNGEGTCEIVAGPIDAEGICNVFSSGSAHDPMQEEMPQNEEPPAQEEPEQPAP